MVGLGIKLATSKPEFSLARVVSNFTMGLFWGTNFDPRNVQ